MTKQSRCTLVVWLVAAVVVEISASALLSAMAPAAGDDPKWKVTRPDSDQQPDEADNSFCLVCHINLEEEELVDIHRPHGVGCELCHGLSDAHSADEDNLTPPEIMWTKQRINPRCMTCHLRDELLASDGGGEDHKEVLARWADEDKSDDGERYCTDCHGEHRIANRTRIWDKETGKLLKQTGGPKMDRQK